MECFVEQVQIVGRTNEFGKPGNKGSFGNEWAFYFMGGGT